MLPLQPLQLEPLLGQASFAACTHPVAPRSQEKLAPHIPPSFPVPRTVVLGALAFLALRPGKGWLRRKHGPLSLEDGRMGTTPPARSQPASTPPAVDDKGSCSSRQVASVEHAGCHALVVVPPRSLLSSKVLALQCFVPLLNAPLCSGSLSSDDAVLSLISSYLGTHSQPERLQAAAHGAAHGPGGSGGASSGAAELRTEARLWEVQWAELAILRRIGRGSFGSVYLAEWSHCQVAVKVLLSQGEGEGCTRVLAVAAAC